MYKGTRINSKQERPQANSTAKRSGRKARSTEFFTGRVIQALCRSM